MDFFKSKQNIKIPDDFEDGEKMKNYLKEFIKIKSLVSRGILLITTFIKNNTNCNYG